MLVLYNKINKLSREHTAAWNLKLVEGRHIWKPPTDHYIKINIDVSMRDGFVIAASVFWDSRGTILGAIVEKIVADSPVVGEAIVARLGVARAYRRGWQKSLSSVMLLKSSSPSNVF